MEQGPTSIARHQKMDLPSRRISSPAPPELSLRAQLSTESAYLSAESPRPSQPSTPTTHALPMNPPSTISHSRRSSFGSTTSGLRGRSASPAPSMPLPAVMPMEASPKPGHLLKNASLYANETLTSFFRRLAFTPDGSLLLTPAGQYSALQQSEGVKASYDIINTVYIYTRGGINKPPIAHLPGHKKPSVVVKCSPIIYTIREGVVMTKNITIDTSSADDSIPSLPDPVMAAPDETTDEKPPPPFLHPNDAAPTRLDLGTASSPGPAMAFSLPYRMVYGVATQDSVLLYDTQQATPLCIVSNLHCATFTDLTWSNDGLTLLMTSSDGFCSTLTFSSGELGEIYVPDNTAKAVLEKPASSISLSSQNTPMPTPTVIHAPPSPFTNISHHRATSNTSESLPPPSPAVAATTVRPASPTRSNSASSNASFHPNFVPGTGTVISNPPLVAGSMPSMTAGQGGSFAAPSPLSITTPPQTPMSQEGSQAGGATVTMGKVPESAKRESQDKAEGGQPSKRRRIAPTLVGDLAK